MKPFYAFALGTILLAVGPSDPKPGLLDPFPDPLGWVFILVGLHGLASSIDARRVPVLRVVGVLALLISVALVVPAVARWLATDPSLGWSADVPRFAFFAVLCYQLSEAALRARSTVGASSFSICGLALLFVLAAPPLAFGAGWTAVGTAGEAAAQMVQLVLVILFIVFAGREWAGAPADEDAPAGEGADS